ncbi:MAG: ATP-binding protein, partial [Deltaproteobacteria bacterium]|nr:ATP-binding protein [Deltaproteobacteria bacterium]
KTFMLRYPVPVIFDEIQNVPELLSWIQVAVDEDPDMTGVYILTGSHQLQLREAITQSLAGRTALLELFPLALNELNKEYTLKDRETLIFKGFMPRLHDKNIRPRRLYRDYFQTYVERDVRKLMAIENQQAFELFLKLLAGRIGHEVNYSALAGQVGISAPQIKKWLSLLEASFLVFKLPPFFNNFGKRLTKSPKVYFVEVGLACYLLGLDNPEQLERDPAFGGLFENMVIAEAYKSRINAGLKPSLYFYRDRYQNEIDLLYPSGSSFIPIEIKSSRTYRSEFLKGIRYFQKLSGSSIPGMLIYDGELEMEKDEAVVKNFRNVWP